MKTHAKHFLILLFAWQLSHAGWGQSNPAFREVTTRFTILIGFPSGDAPSASLPMLVPGSVIPVGLEGAGKDAVLEKSVAFSKTVEKLWATFRLDPGRKPQKSMVSIALLNRAVELPPIENTNLAVSATLVDRNDKGATYRILFRQAGKVLADSTVSVALDGRAVVGGTDGDSAPYIFLIIEPERWQAGDKTVGIVAPVAVSRTAPPFPEEAKKKKITGAVVIEILIDENGEVRNAKVLDSADPLFSKAALDAIQQWKFQPARRTDGKPIAVYSAITFNFQLK